MFDKFQNGDINYFNHSQNFHFECEIEIGKLRVIDFLLDMF